MTIKHSYLLVAALLISLHGNGQDYRRLQDAFKQLRQFSVMTDSVQRKEEIQKWVSGLHNAGQIPVVAEDSVMFLFEGHAKSVTWTGDFNGWGHDPGFRNKGTKIANTNLWYLKSSFPRNARLDYKIVLDGSEYILDPENPHQQWSGVGGGSPNSELRMTDWKEDPELQVRDDISHGTLSPDISLRSAVLGYQLTYRVYLPAGYEKMEKVPTIYVTDGYEYLLPQLGNMVTVMDNLIADKKIKPIAAVFVDQREPVNRANNKRMQELAMNKKYLDFFVRELIPDAEKKFPLSPRAADRAVLGNSVGGLASTFFVFTRPDVFTMAGIQSPAFYIKPQIYKLCSDSSNTKMKVSMTAGLMNDTSKDSQRMKDILAASSCEYHYREVNEGHSWGNWRNLISDILVDFFAVK